MKTPFKKNNDLSTYTVHSKLRCVALYYLGLFPETFHFSQDQKCRPATSDLSSCGESPHGLLLMMYKEPSTSAFEVIVTKHIWHKSATFINTDPTFLCLVFTVLALTSVATTASTWYNASNYKSIVPNKWRNYSRKSVLFFHLVIYRESDSKILQSKILPKLEETAARHSGQRSRWRCFCKFCNLSGSTPRPAKIHQNPLRKGANAWI